MLFWHRFSSSIDEHLRYAKNVLHRPLAPGEKVVLVHVGTHKTASTSLQFMMATFPDRLVKLGILYPLAGQYGNAHHNLEWMLRGVEYLEPGCAGDAHFNASRGTFADVGNEISKSNFSKIFISSENFEYLYDDPDKLHQLKRHIEAWGFKPLILLVHRNQDDYLPSLYRELNDSWKLKKDYKTFFRDAKRDQVVYHKYCNETWTYPLQESALVNGFARVFGREAITVVKYKSTADFLPILFKQLSWFFGEAVTDLITNNEVVYKNNKSGKIFRRPD